jgi:hydroxyacylglutathione hydrolase
MYILELIPALMDATQNYIYYLQDEATGKSAVIDPGDSKPILDFLEKKNLKPDFILNTHSHWDHVNGNLGIKKKFPECKVIANELDAHVIPGFDIGLKYNDAFSLGEIKFKIFHTPGHLKNHISFYSENAKLLFCGDTMFSAGCGGIFEGTPEEMMTSFKLYQTLPNDTKVCCAHEYTGHNIKFAESLEPQNQNIKKRIHQVNFFLQHGYPTVPSSILIEKETNPFMRFNNQELKNALSIPSERKNLEIFEELIRRKAVFYTRNIKNK